MQMALIQKIFEGLYRDADGPESLPWHREEPPVLLDRVVAQQRSPGRALDVGCGEGVASVHLAKQGYSVVGIDFVAAALELARTRARTESVDLDLRQTNVLDYEPADRFDLVLDSGCLHHVPRYKRTTYRERLDRWLAPGGDYLLVHFGKRHALDWRPVGPRRTPRDAIIRLFAPMRLEAYEETWFDLALPVGPRAMAGVYWFRKQA